MSDLSTVCHHPPVVHKLLCSSQLLNTHLLPLLAEYQVCLRVCLSCVVLLVVFVLICVRVCSSHRVVA